VQEPLPAWFDLPEPLGYRIKRWLLGPPLATERLRHERLGKPTALAVFASDNLSSVSYGTEEILRHLVPYVGVAAFALVVPITVALLVVLGFLVLSYLQTIKAYPSAGGAYVVTRDNFGLLPAQVAGVALLIDYILTVAVSVSAGSAALASAYAPVRAELVPVSLAFIGVIAYGNLRGVREAGRLFAVPTYFFLTIMAVLLSVGLGRMFFGHLPVEPVTKPGMLRPGHGGNGLFMGAGLFVVLRAFASGGAAVTGVEAISNGVSAFRPPEWKNARQTLVIMASTLGVMFLGLSMLTARLHVAPYRRGTPTVLSQVGEVVFGTGPTGRLLYYCLQGGTMLILVLAANTSFADFPRLASFHAADNFLPHKLTKRGHRLVYSNGIIALAVVAAVLVVITRARVDALIPLYAIGVFLGFTFSQAGMAKHHLTHRQPGWRSGLAINATGAFLSGAVDLIIAVTKFKPEGTVIGAWVVIVVLPLSVVALVRLHRRYAAEAAALREDAPDAAIAPVPPRHVVYVVVETLDEATTRAFEYARTLRADEVRALHFELDRESTEQLRAAWTELSTRRPPLTVPLDVVGSRGRVLDRAIIDLVTPYVADTETEVTVLVPRDDSAGLIERLRFSRFAAAISATLSRIPHCNVCVIPYDTQATWSEGTRHELRASYDDTSTYADKHGAPVTPVPYRAPIASLRLREHVRIAGRVSAVRVRSRASVPTLECILQDGTGSITVVFLGRRRVPGIEVGARLVVEGVVGEYHGRPAILNPTYEILAEDHP
jgi:amino acid transporter